MQRRRELMGMQGVLKTVSGPIVTVNDALARNAKSLVVNFAPVQAAGTPSPDNVLPISGWTGVTGYKTGANVWDEEWESGRFDTATGTPISDSNAIKSKNYISVVPNTQYHFTILSNTSMWAMFFDSDKNIITTGLPSTSASYNCRAVGNYTVKMPANCYYIKFYANAYGAAYANNISVNYPATDTAYHPYTGTTYPVTFPAVGKNLFNANATDTDNGYAAGRYLTEYGDTSLSENYNVSEYIPVQPNTVYTVSSLTGNLPALVFYSSNKTYISGEKYAQRSTISFTTPGGCAFIRISIPIANIDSFQLELGSTPTAYEPYTNTIYGGYVDLVRGVLVADIAIANLGNLFWIRDPNRDTARYAALPNCKAFDQKVVACSCYKAGNQGIVQMTDYEISGNISYGSTACCFKDSRTVGMTSAEVQELLAGQEVAYYLATPITYQLTPQTIAMLKGTNNVWSNANGNVELTYYAQ